jgi:hypothetical protein
MIKAGLATRNISRNTPMAIFKLHIRDPWTMPYLSTVDILIDALHKQIGPEHVLYRREAFPLALRRDPDAIIYETDDEPEIHALVFLSWNPNEIKRKRSVEPKTVILADREAVQAQMDMDNTEWVAQFRGAADADLGGPLDQAEIHQQPLISTLGAIRSFLEKPPNMARYNVVFETKEIIFGVVPRANDWVKYSCVLKIKDGGKLPVSLEMTFIPPHPFSVNMPLAHTIRAASISGIYFRVIKFLGKYGIEFRG